MTFNIFHDIWSLQTCKTNKTNKITLPHWAATDCGSLYVNPGLNLFWPGFQTILNRFLPEEGVDREGPECRGAQRFEVIKHIYIYIYIYIYSSGY